jgi:hypothetical protein
MDWYEDHPRLSAGYAKGGIADTKAHDASVKMMDF